MIACISAGNFRKSKRCEMTEMSVGCSGSDTAWQVLLLEEDAYVSWNDGLRSRAPTILLASGRLQMVSFTSILAHGSPVALLATKMPEFFTIVLGERVLLHTTELSSCHWHNR